MSREMKDSGIEWFSQIPLDWKVSRVGLHFDIILGKMLCQSKLTEDYTLEPYFCAANVHFDGVTNDGLKQMWFSTTEKEQYLVQKGDLLVVEGGAGAGGSAIVVSVKKPTYIQNSIMIVRSKKISKNSYLRYLLEYIVKNGYVDVVCNKATIPHFTKDKLANVPYLVSDEQLSIADFLDTQCAHIDSIIEKTRAAIEEYKKLKQSVITQAVTKGIRPNREMKDSGIEWIGKTPEEWKILKTKYVFTIKKDIANEEGYQVLSITQRGIIPKDLSKNEGQLAANYSNYQIVNIGDFAMNHMDLLTGWVDISKYYGVTSPDYRVFRLFDIENNNSRYYLYLMQLCYFNRVFYGLGQGVSGMGRWRLQADKFLNMYIVNPPIDEQSEIVNYLDEKTAAIDSLIQKKEQLITELEAYKKSLIYEYVTGKKEVSQPESKIKYTIEFKMALLMCRILQYTNIKGRIHMQKVIYSSDILLNLFSEIQYYRFQKGPYDINIEKYEHSLMQYGWVKVYKKGGKTIYKKTNGFNEYTSFYKKVFSEMDLEIKRICQLFNVLSTAQAGKTATVVASWNDFLIDGVTPTDEMIVNDIVTNWTANKANIPRKTWFDTLEQIKSKGLVPKGFGKKTLHLEEAKHAH